MKEKNKSSQKNTGFKGSPSAERTGSGTGMRRSSAAVPPDSSVQQTATAKITERKRSEEALKESEQKYKLLIEATNTGYVIIDEKGLVLDANREYVRMTGRGRLEDILGRPVTDWTASYDLERNAAEVRKCMESGAVRNLLIDYVDEQRKITPVEINATVLPGPSFARIFTICRDITGRKRAENALKESEEKYRRLYNETPVLLQSINRDARLVNVNDYWLKIMGYQRNEVIGRKVTDFYTEASRTYVEEVIQPAFFRDGVVKDVSFQFVTKNGDVLDVLLTATAERDTAGNVVRSWGVITDITERKRAEEALQKSERMLQTIIDTEPDCIKLIDEESRLIMMNRAGLNMIQADSLDKVKGQFVCPLVAPEYQHAFMDLTRKVFQGGSGSMEFRMVGMRGSPLWLETHAVPLRNEKDKIIAMLGVTRDITERKRTEEALRENQSRLDLALQSAHMGVWRWEIKENKRYYDDLTCQVLGIEATKFTGTVEEFYRAVHPEDREKLKAVLARTLEYDVPYEPSYRVVWLDGSVHSITSRGRLFRDDKGQPARISGILWDITDQRRLEQELIETEKLESIGTLAGGIAHDFNNLLQGVFGFISMAKLTFDQKEKSLAMLAQAEKALHQSVNLTSQLLTFSKGGKPVKKVLSLKPLIENSVAFALSGSRVTYEIVTAENLRAVEADEGQIGQVIQNIVLNADQAMPLGGMIRVSIRNTPAAAIVPPTDLQGDLVEISIRDQGTGIPAEHITRIFDPYFTTKEKGSGLGLATSYSIVKNHGGLVRVQSGVGKGTTFFIYLPASDAEGEETDHPAIPATTRKGRILVMDDEEMIRTVAGELLTALGHEVAFAEKGETALEAYRAAQDADRPFDVVILDLTIRGGMGGMETMRKLAEIDPDVKAVVSSGYSDDAALLNHLDQGFRAFLKKPYNMEELQRTLNALFA